jgi:hypothetical protein
MKKFSLAIAVVVLAGCSSSNPTIQTGEDAEISFDGLHRVDNARFASSWADPDIDFSRYNKVMPGGAEYIVSRVPPDMVGRGEVYLSSVGEATLIIEVIDSMSNEVIFRAAERRAAEPGQGTMGMRSTSVSTWAEVRRLIRRWARTLREGLDSIPGADAPAAE